MTRSRAKQPGGWMPVEDPLAIPVGLCRITCRDGRARPGGKSDTHLSTRFARVYLLSSHVFLLCVKKTTGGKPTEAKIIEIVLDRPGQSHLTYIRTTNLYFPTFPRNRIITVKYVTLNWKLTPN
jgi:hypothetical protein